MSKVTIRRYKDSDYGSVMRNMAEGGLFDRTWDTRANLKRIIGKDPSAILVAVKNGTIAGSVYDIYFGWQGMIFRLAVLRKFRGQDIGARLMRAAHKELKKKGAQPGCIIRRREENKTSQLLPQAWVQKVKAVEKHVEISVRVGARIP